MWMRLTYSYIELFLINRFSVVNTLKVVLDAKNRRLITKAILNTKLEPSLF